SQRDRPHGTEAEQRYRLILALSGRPIEAIGVTWPVDEPIGNRHRGRPAGFANVGKEVCDRLAVIGPSAPGPVAAEALPLHPDILLEEVLVVIEMEATVKGTWESWLAIACRVVADDLQPLVDARGFRALGVGRNDLRAACPLIVADRLAELP